jgi:hypothetical protein
VDIVKEGLQYGDKTEGMSLQNDVQFTPTKEDLSDSHALVVKQEEASIAVGFICLCTSHCPKTVTI